MLQLGGALRALSDFFRDLDRARDDVSASSAGGAPFLISFGCTLFATAIISFFVPVRTAAFVAIFQGGVALPAAFLLERRMGTGPMAPDNPLRSLSIQMAMSQVVALPAVIIAFSLEPATVPAALAAIGGGHFLPYSWLHRTRVYVALGATVSIGAFVLQAILGAAAFPWILIYMSLTYWVAAPAVYGNAMRLARQRLVV